MSKKKSRRSRTPSPKTVPSYHGAWDRLSHAKQHGISLTILLILSLSFFAPIHFSGKQLVAGDTVQWRSMAQSMIEYEEETGETALWAGHAFAGMPGYMISPELSVPQVDTLIRELRKLAWPTSHMMLLFAGMYLLAWYLTRESLASVMAAVMYGFTTYIPVILVAGHNSKFIALAWAPWLLLAFIHAMKRRNLVSALLFAVALAVNLRAGHVQITYYATMAAGIWWLVEGIHALRSGLVRPFLRSTGFLVLGSVLGLMMVAQPYLAHAEVTPFTIRGSAAGGAVGGMGWGYAMAWSQGKWEMMTLLIADAFGGASPTYWGDKTFTGGPHYFGVTAIFLAVLTMWRIRDRVTLSLGVATIVMVLFSLGENLGFLNRLMFNYFPMFSSFRVPETWLSVTAMLVALLAARGLVSIRRSRSEPQQLSSQTWARLAGGMGAFLLLMVLFGSSLMSFEKGNERTSMLAQIQAQYPGVSASNPEVVATIEGEMARRVEQRVERFGADAARSFMVILLVGLMLFLYHRRTLPYWMTASLIVLIVAVDLFGVGRRFVREEVLSAVDGVEERVARYPFDEFISEREAQSGGEGSFRVLSLENGAHPAQNARPSFHHESLGGYSGAKLRVYQDFLDEILFSKTGGSLNAAAMNMTNVRFLVGSRGLPGYNLVFQDDQTGMSVFENPNALARAYLVDEVRVAPDAQAAWSILQNPSFDPSTTAIVYDEAQLAAHILSNSISDSDSTSLRSVVTESYEAQNMVFEVETDRPRLLVVAEVYYPEGWTAMVNETKTKIVQVNHLLRGIPVPEGSSRVELSFEPASHRNGILIAGASTAFTYGLLLFLGASGYVRKRKVGAPA